MTTAVRTDRRAVLAYRLDAQGVTAPGPGPPVLEVGVQDTPPGSTAPLALRLRTREAVDPYQDPGLALVHGVRGAMHLHRAADLPGLAAALLPEDAADLRVAAHGQFFNEMAAGGLPAGTAFDAVSSAMTRVMADGRERTKGELSGAVTPLVPGPVAPWCGGCGVRHLHDGLFRMASLQAGLRLRPAGDGSAVFLPPPDGWAPESSAAAARRRWLRRFLRHCGPATPDALAAWLALSPPAARRWWSLSEGDLVRVEVDGRRLWTHADDVAALVAAQPRTGVLLLPPYDPVVEVAERAVLVPDAARRRQVWRPAANPGVLLVDGEVGGVWRRRRAGRRLTVTVTAFDPLPPTRRRAVADAAAGLFAHEALEIAIDQAG